MGRSLLIFFKNGVVGALRVCHIVFNLMSLSGIIFWQLVRRYGLVKAVIGVEDLRELFVQEREFATTMIVRILA